MKVIQNQGFSLIQTMLAAGLLGGLSLGSMKLFNNQTKGMNHLKYSIDAQELKNYASKILAEREVCEGTFGSGAFDLNSPPASITQIESNSGEVVLITGTNSRFSTLSIDSFDIQNVQHLGDRTSLFEIAIKHSSVKSDSTSYGAKSKTIIIPIIATVQSAGIKVIQTCGEGIADVPFSRLAVFDDPVSTTSEFIVPNGVSKIRVQIWGAGGGGGGAYFNGTNNNKTAGGGGGGGSYIEVVLDVAPGDTFPIEIGEGGAGGYPNSNGGKGEASSFGNYFADGGDQGLRGMLNSIGIGGDGGCDSGLPKAHCSFDGTQPANSLELLSHKIFLPGGDGSHGAFVNGGENVTGQGGLGGGSPFGGTGGGPKQIGTLPGGGGGGGNYDPHPIDVGTSGAPGARGEVRVWY